MGTMSAITAGLRDSELKLSGRSIASGLGMGRAWVVGDVLKWTGPLMRIGPEGVDDELAHLARAVEEALAELERYAVRIEAELDAPLADIFRAHGVILRDLFASG